MKKILKGGIMSKALGLIILFFSLNCFAGNDLIGRKFLFMYEGDQHYQVSFTDASVTWLGVKGDEVGRSETDKYQSSLIAPGVYFIQWSEQDGTFVALTINLRTKTIHSTGISGHYTWFRKGKFRFIKIPFNTYATFP